MILVVAGVAIAGAIVLQSFLVMLIASAAIAFDLYWFYVRYYKRVKPKYPMASPDAKPVDAYFPRTNIPRPLHEDPRRIHEEKHKLDKIRKLRMQRRRKKT